MVLKPDEFTEQAQEVLGKSQEIVRRYSHSQWDVEHILMALLEQENGVPADVLRQVDVSIPAMRARLHDLLDEGPKGSRTSRPRSTLRHGPPVLSSAPRPRPSV